MRTIAFFNNKGGVGKTTLVYHIAWMLSELGVRTLVADLDPQANATAMFLDDEVVERLWLSDGDRDTIFGAVEPLMEGTGDILAPPVRKITNELALLPGDLGLAGLEQELSSQWPNCLDGQPRAFRVESAFARLISEAASSWNAEICLVDVGPNLGAINRSALVACDEIVVPLGPDLFSLQGLRNLGPTLRQWRTEWQDRRQRNPRPDEIKLPSGSMDPLGYVILQHGQRAGRPVAAYDRWMRQIPSEFRRSLLDRDENVPTKVEDDPYCLGFVKHFHSLVPLGQEARKPIFMLKSADGALGAHQQAVARARTDFEALASSILEASSERRMTAGADERVLGV